jgi:hypothetical protein
MYKTDNTVLKNVVNYIINSRFEENCFPKHYVLNQDVLIYLNDEFQNNKNYIDLVNFIKDNKIFFSMFNIEVIDNKIYYLNNWVVLYSEFMANYCDNYLMTNLFQMESSLLY